MVPRLPFRARSVLLSVAIAACAPGGTRPSSACSFASDCNASEVCVAGACVPRDAGAAVDAARTDASNDSAMDVGLAMDAIAFDTRVGDAALTLDSRVPDAGSDTNTATDVVSIAISPANPTLRVTRGGAPMTINFTLIGTLRNGTSMALATGGWRVSSAAIGTIVSATGVFTASEAGGTTTVAVAFGRLAPATTTVTVELTSTLQEDGVTSTDIAGFDTDVLAPDNDSTSPQITYPLAGAVMPKSVVSPRIMWTPRVALPGAAVTRVRLSRPHATLTWYSRNSPVAVRLAAADWAAFAASDLGTTITLTVTTSDRGTRRESSITFRTVDAVLGGKIYYWSPTSTQLERIDVLTGVNERFLPRPGAGCIGCHALDRSGRRLMAFLQEGAVTDLIEYDVTRDLTADPAPNLGRQSYEHRQCGTYNPSATRYLMAPCGRGPGQQRADMPTETLEPFLLIDSATHLPVGLAPGAAGIGYDPEWSPDGRTIAFTDQLDRLVTEEAFPGDTFGPSVVLHAGFAGAINWHPTWSPNSAWLAFQVGRGSLRWTGDGSTQTGELYMIARGGGAPVHLAQITSGATGRAFRPIFSPYDEGGYFWLLYTSTRPYGTAASGGIVNHKQIWISAIRNRPDGTTDPSEIGYWLAGQSAETSLSPFWTPPECRANGQVCGDDAECCSGVCGPNGPDGVRLCIPPTRCEYENGICATSSDCCDGLQCGAPSRCERACRVMGADCASRADCCAGLACDGTTHTCVDACNEEGEACGAGTPCCAGLTCPSTSGLCEPSCSDVAMSCSGNADCCSSLVCDPDTHGCRHPCRETGGSCDVDRDCCQNFRCNTSRHTCEPVIPS